MKENFNTTDTIISLPQGVRDTLPVEAGKVTPVETGLTASFERYGYSRVKTPMLEYEDVLSLGMGKELRGNMVKFIDPTGRAVAIRPDITPQIARIVATRMRDQEPPLKLYYNESVLRYEAPSICEVHQIGGEHFTVTPSPEVDGEMITIAIEALIKIGLTDFKVDIGDVSFLRSILDSIEMDKATRSRIIRAISLKDSSDLRRRVDSLGGAISDKDCEALIALTTFYGEEEVIEKAGEFATKDSGKASLAYLSEILRIITDKGYKDYVTLDLGEVRGFDYYTGIIFEGFASGVGKAILTGGRYDNLLKNYSSNLSATGFAFDVDNIVSALGE